ncbi:MAG: guanylate cyclase [Chlorobiaceae bacterium]|nr:guanylate cyclase [Chlorobiaceae bacterium]MBA4309998.1 guanylate cyclase [Chlorobiaceae bacterium]
MAESFSVNKLLSDEEKYLELLPQIKSLLNKNENLISNLSNFTAALNQSFEKISWVGFYLFDGKKLYLGPFQGKVACTTIEIGKGVCGAAAEKKETIIVPDVHEFPGHIFCDGGTNSEIVIPIIKQKNLIGVLDLDSYEFSAFNETDKIYLEKLIEFLTTDIF